MRARCASTEAKWPSVGGAAHTAPRRNHLRCLSVQDRWIPFSSAHPIPSPAASVGNSLECRCATLGGGAPRVHGEMAATAERPGPSTISSGNTSGAGRRQRTARRSTVVLGRSVAGHRRAKRRRSRSLAGARVSCPSALRARSDLEDANPAGCQRSCAVGGPGVVGPEPPSKPGSHHRGSAVNRCMIGGDGYRLRRRIRWSRTVLVFGSCS